MSLQHDAGMAGSMELTGSFQGHVLPGALFLVWGGWWLLQLVRDGRGWVDRPGGALEVGWVAPVGKLVLPLVGVIGELAPDGFRWEPATLNNWQHATMYAGFVLAGAVDLLARAGRLGAGATRVAFALACGLAALLFAGHGHMGGLPDAVHGLLVVLFLGTGLVAVAESVLPRSGLAWLRLAGVVALGSWLIQIAYLLYRSDLDLMAHASVMQAYLAFSWHLLAVTVLLVAVRAVLLPDRDASRP